MSFNKFSIDVLTNSILGLKLYENASYNPRAPHGFEIDSDFSVVSLFIKQEQMYGLCYKSQYVCDLSQAMIAKRGAIWAHIARGFRCKLDPVLNEMVNERFKMFLSHPEKMDVDVVTIKTQTVANVEMVCVFYRSDMPPIFVCPLSHPNLESEIKDVLTDYYFDMIMEGHRQYNFDGTPYNPLYNPAKI